MPAALADGLLLRQRTDEQIDQRIDRFCLRQVDAALEGRLDQATDDLCTADRFSVFETDVDGKPIEISDVAIEQDHGDLGPGLGMDDRATAIAFGSWTHT